MPDPGHINGSSAPVTVGQAADRLLVMDDEIDIGRYIADVAADIGFDCRVTSDPEAFKDSVRHFRPTVIVIDLQMPDADGVELLRYLASQDCSAGIIVASGMDTRVLATATRLGEEHGLTMLGALRKPVTIDTLEAKLQQAMRVGWAPSEHDLAHAISAGQLEVHYQPKVSLARGRVGEIRDCEALVRWIHPQQGMISPAAFIPLAENCGLIGGLTDFVLNRSLAQIADWRRAGSEFSVAVNLAAHMLDDLTLPDRIVSAVRAHGLPPDLLMLEITESAVMSHIASAMDILTRIRLKGCGLSIDDFGTGYSSLVQLYRMPFSELKIDKSFVLDIGKSDEAATIVRSLTDLAHNLGLSVCAEGFESQAALDFLIEAGCEKGQGFYLCKPCSAAEFHDFSTKWNTKINAAERQRLASSC